MNKILMMRSPRTKDHTGSDVTLATVKWYTVQNALLKAYNVTWCTVEIYTAYTIYSQVEWDLLRMNI